MEEAHIQDGDILVVNRALSPTSGKIIVAVLNGEFTVKRVVIKGEELFLMPENPRFAPLKIDPQSDFQVWGVVTYVIHKT